MIARKMPDELIHMTHVRGMGRLPELLQQSVGFDRVERVFADLGLPLALSDVPDMKIPLNALIRMFETAGEASGDRCFGLRVGMDMGHDPYGLMAAYSSQAPTLYDALVRLRIGIRMHQPGARLMMQKAGVKWLWSYSHPGISSPDSSRHHVDHILPSFISLVRVYLGPDWLPRRLYVPYSDDNKRQELQEALPCEWLFSRAAIAVELPDSLIRTRRPEHGLGSAQQNYVTSCDILAGIARAECTDIVDIIKSVIQLQLLEDGSIDIESVAQLTGLSVRNLQRRLQSSGTTFRDILQSARLQRAVSLISETQLTLTEIALIVGYHDPGNFSRAFRKRYGRVPLSFRRNA